MSNKLIPVNQFLAMARGKLPAVSKPAPEPAFEADIINSSDITNNCAFVSATCRQREFGNRNCVVLALVGPNGGTRAVGAMSVDGARDLIAQLHAACAAVEGNRR